ncbi:MAG: hypothetical protein KI793_24405 [Rivularia sp. (in: Bacteria)]|nr:hypothetical protein [Rivularia sp. MS3]
MTSISNGEFPNNYVEQPTILEFIQTNRTGNIDTINEGESFASSFGVSKAELINNELNEIKLLKTASFEVTTQLDNGVFITFTLEVKYDNAYEFSAEDLLENSSFIDELTAIDATIAAET